MIISRGGKAYEPSESSVPDPQKKDMSHAAFVLWECMIGMQVERQYAVAAWERMQKLYETADGNSEHPNIGKVYSRIETLRKEVEYHQKEFLEHEEIANRVWRETDDSMFAVEGLGIMYHVSPNTDLPALWKHALGANENYGEPAPFPMSTTALQFVSPALARKYQGGRR